MWTGTVNLSELDAQSRWTVEVFSNKTSKKSESAYDLVPVGQVVILRKGALSPQEYPDHVFNYIGLQNIEPLTGDLIEFEPTVGAGVRSRSKIFREGDVLYGRLRPYLNKVYLAEGPVAEGICSGEFYVLISDKKEIFPQYLRAILASEYVLQYVGSLQMGSALPRLQVEDFLKIQIPLPPLTVQEKLVAYLDGHNRHRKQLVQELTQLPHALNSAFTEALESGSSPKPPLIDLSASVDYDNRLPVADFAPKRRGRRSANEN